METAPGGDEAIELLASGAEFDIIFCDLSMPAVDGMEVHAELQRSHPPMAERFVFMSGGAYTPQGEAYLNDCGAMRIDKPVAFPIFDRLIEEIAEGASSFRAAA